MGYPRISMTERNTIKEKLVAGLPVAEVAKLTGRSTAAISVIKKGIRPTTWKNGYSTNGHYTNGNGNGATTTDERTTYANRMYRMEVALAELNANFKRFTSWFGFPD